MKGEVIDFVPAAHRIRVLKRQHPAPQTTWAAADLFWLTVVCFPPLCFPLFMAHAVVDTLIARGQGR